MMPTQTEVAPGVTLTNRSTLLAAIASGELIGAYRVIRHWPDSTVNSGYRAEVECSRCGRIRTISFEQLYIHAKHSCISCPACRNNNNTGRPPITRRNCHTCDDCPALRPRNGVCQECGERWQAPRGTKQ